MSLEVDVEARLGRLALRAAFTVEAGPTLVLGPNGAGKTTLLRLLTGAVRLRRGRVVLDGRVLDDLTVGTRLPPEARQVAYLPQSYALFPHLSVLDNVAFGAPGGSAAGRRARAETLLDDLGVADLADARPGTLSGGQRQRVALARALAPEPRALLLDEPLAALDLVHRARIRRFLVDRLAALSIPTLVVTHDRADLDAFGDPPVLVLEAGELIHHAPWSTLRAAPTTDLLRALAGDG